MIQAMIITIEKLNRIQEDLLTLSTKKREILIEGNVEQLSKLVQEEAKLVKQLGTVESKRIEQMVAFLQEQQVGKQEITLSEFIDLVPTDDQKAKLQEAAIELQHTIGKLQEINNLNTKLITDSLQFIQHSLDVITDHATEQVNYERPAGNQKKAAQTERRSIFDTKA